MTTIALLTTALLFGGMVLYSFGFAAFLFTALPATADARHKQGDRHRSEDHVQVAARRIGADHAGTYRVDRIRADPLPLKVRSCHAAASIAARR